MHGRVSLGRVLLFVLFFAALHGRSFAQAGPPKLDKSLDYQARYQALSEFALVQPLPEYALDSVAREVPASGKFDCPDVEQISYRGTSLSYGKSIRIAKEFAPAVAQMEKIIREVAIEVYGRAPNKLRTLGTYNCRRMRIYSTYLSEHALANAIDLEGFVFGPVAKTERAKTAPELRGGFTVLVEKHWKGGRGARATHQKFLQELILRLIERDVFRVYLGPNYPNHHDHFHLDISTFRLIDI